MAFAVDNERKVACWYFTNAEQEDAAGMAAAIEAIRPQFAEWKAKGYTPAIFRSVKADLEDTIYGLTKHNYMVMARKELAEEKAAALLKSNRRSKSPKPQNPLPRRRRKRTGEDKKIKCKYPAALIYAPLGMINKLSA